MSCFALSLLLPVKPATAAKPVVQQPVQQPVVATDDQQPAMTRSAPPPRAQVILYFNLTPPFQFIIYYNLTPPPFHFISVYAQFIPGIII